MFNKDQIENIEFIFEKNKQNMALIHKWINQYLSEYDKDVTNISNLDISNGILTFEDIESEYRIKTTDLMQNPIDVANNHMENERTLPLIGCKIMMFYQNETYQTDGMYFDEILSKNDNFWESCHSFIQWIFPTNEPSKFNIDAPILSQEVIKLWNNNDILKYNLGRAYNRWLIFANNSQIYDSLNHNWLRTTRVLKCLNLLGRKDLANEYFGILLAIKYKIPQDTWNYWEKAMEI